MMDLNTLLTDFLEYCEIERNRSQKTVQNYDHYLRRFLDWMKVTSPKDITLPLVKKYRLRLNHHLDPVTKQPLKKVTQAYHIIALRSFLKYLAKQDIVTLAAEKIELPKIASRSINYLDDEELERLLAAPWQHPKYKSKSRSEIDIATRRDKAILELLFSAGLRVSELIQLNHRGINLNKDEFTVTGKGDKARVVFLSPAAKDALKKYLERRHDNFDALFIAHDRKSRGQAAKDAVENQPRLTPRSVQRLIKTYAQIAGINKDITTHSLRHTFATDLLLNGADIRSVQAMLGHASITTTQIYTHITNKQLKETYQKFHGRKRR